MAFETARINNTTMRRVHKTPYVSARGWHQWTQFPLHVPACCHRRVSSPALSHLSLQGMGVRRVQSDGASALTLNDLCRQSWSRRSNLNHSLTKKGTL